MFQPDGQRSRVEFSCIVRIAENEHNMKSSDYKVTHYILYYSKDEALVLDKLTSSENI